MFQFDLAVFFDMCLAPHDIFFAGIELNHVVQPVESDLSINTVSVYLSVRANIRLFRGYFCVQDKVYSIKNTLTSP